MKKLLNRFATVLLLVFASHAQAIQFTGTNLIYFSFVPQHGFYAGDISGEIDLQNFTITVTQSDSFAGMPLSAELLPPGSYTRTDLYGNTYNINVGPGQVGGYFEFDYFAQVGSIATLWERLDLGNRVILEMVDGDGDGIPGFTYSAGPLAQLALGYQLIIDQPLPAVNVSIDVSGGSSHECSTIGGDQVEVSADIELLEGAILESISWSVDGQVVSGGNSISQFLSLGSHQIQVTATIDSGASASASATVHVVDTQPPSIDAAFVDNRSGSAITAIETRNTSFVNASINVSDVCDPAPYVRNFGGFEVFDGDTLKIQGNLGKVELNTYYLELLVQTSDASNNSAQIIKTLNITP